MSKFFQTQCDHPIKNDWVSNIRKVLVEINLELSFEEIRSMKITTFQKTS